MFSSMSVKLEARTVKGLTRVDVEAGGVRLNAKKRPKKYAPGPGEAELGISIDGNGDEGLECASCCTFSSAARHTVKQ